MRFHLWLGQLFGMEINSATFRTCFLLVLSLLTLPTHGRTPSCRLQAPSDKLSSPLKFERHLGDLDGMVKRHEIRVLVVPSRSGFFYDAGRPEGIFYETFEEFQHFVNERLKSGPVKVEVTYLPVRIDELGQALSEGKGDVIGFPVVVTPERAKEALFTTPVAGAKQVLVTGPGAPVISSIEELSGKEIYVNPITAYYDS